MYSFPHKLAHAMVLIASILMVNVALGNPQGGTVTNGSATISNAGNTTTINQSSQQAIVQWNSFNISAQEKTQFIQPNSHSVALNRINPQNGASQIYGQLTSNGRIILVNGAGIFFGPSARVDVGGLIASTSDITNANFLAGKYIFDQATGYHGSITNEGKIIASKYGLVALLGDSVSNTGVIQARLGSIVMGAGSIFTLDFNGDQLINFSVDAPASAASTGIHNSGKLLADGGQILVTAKAAAGVLDNVIDMSGVAETRSVSRQGGEIILSGDDNTNVIVSGTLNASGGTTGGTIQVLGGKVYLTATALLNASGLTGGGNINVGGNEHGVGPLLNATSTTIDAGAILNASAINSGNGGNVIVWSNDYTNYNGSVLAQGGSVSGNGGFSEISGQQVLNFTGTANLSASHGAEGTLLLDPENVSIQATGTSSDPIISGVFTPTVASSILTVATLEAALANENVNVTTGSTGSQAGTITLAASSPLTWSSDYALTLTAASTITLSSAITAANGSLSLVATSTMALNANITVNTLMLSAGTGTTAKNITPSAAANINVANFDLIEGNWKQSSATLPVFNVTNDFELNAGGGPSSLVSFIRVLGGTGTTGSPYEITDIYGFEGIGSNTTTMSDSYELMNSINATGTATWNGGAGFIPINAGGFNNGTNFTGTFNGQDYTVNGLTINTNNNSQFQSENYLGLFEQTDNATIENLLLTNLNIYAPNNEVVGGVVGLAANTNLSDIYVTGTVNGGSYVGGLVGNLGSSTSDTSSISDSYSSASVTGLYAGGLAGIMGNDGTISNSYTTGTITANNDPQGAGGLVGLVSDGNGTITDSYSSAVINSNGSAGGGLIGVSQSSGFSINNSFWDTDVSGQSAAVGSGSVNLSNVTGGCLSGSCTNGGTANLSSESTYTSAGWDFTNTWAIGSSYPYLKVFPNIFSGTVSNGTSSVSGLTIDIYQNGTLLGTTTTNGGGGFSYSPTGLVSGDSLLFAIAGGTVFSNDVTVVPNLSNGIASVNLQLTANTLEIGDLTNTNSITNTELSTAITGLSSNTVLYTTPGNILTIGNSHASINMATTSLTNLVLGTDSITFGSGTTTGNITFNGPEVLSQDASLSNSVGDITVSSTGSIDGAYNLSLGSKANIINGTIGGNTPLASFSLTDAAGGGTGADIIGPNSINTTGNQSYSDAVTISGGPGLTSSGGSITFSTINGTTAGSNNLNLDASNINLNGNIGSTVPLGEISFSDASGGNSDGINAGNVSITATNSININGTFYDSNSANDNLTLNSAQVNLAGNIGNSAFNNVTISDASGGTTGNLYLTNDNINIDTANDITINSTIDSASGNNYNLTLSSSNTVELNSSIGSMQPLGSLTVETGALTVGASAISTVGNQNYNFDPTANFGNGAALGGTLTFNNVTSTRLSTLSGNQGEITFGADVNFNAPTTTVSADGGVVYYGNIEGATALTTGGTSFGNFFNYGSNNTQEIGSSSVPLTSLTFSSGGYSDNSPLEAFGDGLEFNNYSTSNNFNIYTVGNQIFNNTINILFQANVNFNTTGANASVQLKNGISAESEEGGNSYSFNITAAGTSSSVAGALAIDTDSSININFTGGSTGVLTSNASPDASSGGGPGTSFNINSGTFVLGNSNGLANANLNLPAGSIFQLPGDINGGSGAVLNFQSANQLQVTGNSTADSNVVFNFFGSSSFTVGTGLTFTVNGQINGGAKDGLGTLVLGGTASNLDITTGLVQIVSNGNVNGTTTVESGAALNIDNTTVNGLSVTLNGTGIGGTGALTGTGTAELDSSSISLNSDSTIGAPGSSDQFTFDSATSIDGGANLTLSGLGTIILNGSVGANTPLNTFTSSVANLTLGLSSINSGGDQDFSNSIVTVNDANGSGTFTFNNSNGNVNFTNSTLQFTQNDSAALNVNISNGTLNLNASMLNDNDQGQGVVLQGNIVIGPGNSVISDNNSNYANFELTGGIDSDNSQTGTLEFSGNGASVQVDNSIGGGTPLYSVKVDSGASVNFGNPNASYINIDVNTLNDQDYNGYLSLNVNPNSYSSSNLSFTTQNGTINFNSGSNLSAQSSYYLSSITINGNSVFNGNSGLGDDTDLEIASGTAQVFNSNAFGGANLNIDSTLELHSDLSSVSVLGGNGSIVVLPGNSFNLLNISEDGGISFNGTYNIGAGASLNVQAPVGYSYYGNTAKSGTGELIYSSNSNDNTSIDVQQGTLSFPSNSNTEGGTITIESGATFSLDTGNTLPINIISNGGTIANSDSNIINGTLTLTNGTNTISSSNSADYFEVQQSVDSDSSNSGSLTLTGPGVFQFDSSIGDNNRLASLTASNTGGVNFQADVATVGIQDYQAAVNFVNNSTLSSTSGTITFESASSINYPFNTGDATNLTFIGNVILNNTASSFGAANLNIGDGSASTSVTYNNANALAGLSNVNLNSNASLVLDADFTGGYYTFNDSGTIKTSGTRIFAGGGLLEAGTIEVDGSGSLDVQDESMGTIIKNGTGSLFLDSYDGGGGNSTVNAGTLSISGGNFGNSTFVVESGGTLNFNNITTSNLTIDLNGTGVGGNGALTGTGANELDSSSIILQSNASIETPTSADSFIFDANTAITAAASSNAGLTVSAPQGGFALPYVDLTDGGTGNLVVNTNGDITQNDVLEVAGTSAFNAGAGAITLNNTSQSNINSAYTGNTLGGAVSVSNSGANDITIINNGTLTVGTISAGQNIYYSASAGDIDIGSAITLASGNTLNLSSAGNIDINASIEGSGAIVLNAASSAQSILNTNNEIDASSFTLQTGNYYQNSSGGALAAFNISGDFSLTYDGTSSFTRVVGGNGSSGTPYLLADIYGLQGAATLSLSNDYTLSTNIDASASQNWSAGFKAIGTASSSYTGTFEGASKTISNLFMSSSANDSGLFGVIGSAGIVQDVGLVTPNITGTVDVGALAGTNHGTIANSYVSGGTVSSTTNGANVGGLVGVNTNAISIAYNTAAVSASGNGNIIGAFVGSNSGIIANTYNIGNVNATDSSSNIGGFAGANSGTIKTSYSVGAVTAANGSANLGGFVGVDNSGTYLDNYFDTTTALTSNGIQGGNNVNITGLTDTEMKNFNKLSGFSFSGGSPIWAFTQNTSVNGGYAVLTALTPGPYQPTSTTLTIAGQVIGGNDDSISFYANGVLLGSIVTDSSGNYSYSTTSASTGNDLLAYVTTGGFLGSAVTLAPSSNSITGLNISLNTVEVGDANTNSFSNTDLVTAVGSLGSSLSLFSVSGNNITLNSDISLFTTATSAFALNGNISGSANIQFSGATNLSTDATVSTSGGSVSMTSVNGAHALTVSSTTGTTISGAVGGTTPLTNLTVDNGGTISGSISGATSVTANGGTLDLTNSNSYSGGTSVSNGTVATNNSSGLGTGGVSVGSGGAVDLSGQVTVANSFSLSGDGAIYDVDGSGTDTVQGTVALASGSTATLDAASGSTLKLTNTVSGPGSLDLQDTGTVSLQGAVNVNSVSSTASNVALGASVTTAGSQSYTGTTSLGTNVTLADTASGMISLDAVTGNGHGLTLNTAGSSSVGSYSDGSGASSLIKAGSGTLTLSSASGYTGGTQINSGAISISNNTALGTGGVSVATGTTLDVNGDITVGNAITLTGTGAINDTSSSGTDILQGAVTLGSASTISAASGSTLEFENSMLSGASALTLSGAGTINLQEAVSGLTSLSAAVANLTIGAGITSTGVQTYSHAVTLSGTETLATTNSAITFNGTLSGAGALTLASGTAQNVLGGVVGGGAALTSLSSTGNGGISIGANVTTAGSQSYTGTTVLAASVTLQDTSLNGSVSLNAVTGNGNGLTINTLGNSSINGIFADGSGASSLTQAGSGILTLNAANTYSGATNVNAGTLQVGVANATSVSSAINIASGATLDLHSLSSKIGSLSGAGSIINIASGTTLTSIQGVTSSTYYGTLAGAGTFQLGSTSADTGTLALNGNNSGLANIVIQHGFLQVSTNNSLAATANNVVSGAELLLNTSTNTTFSNAITANGVGVSIAGAVVDTSSGLTNTLSNLTLGTSAGIGVSSSNETLVISNALTGGAVGITKTGSGTVELSAANTYSGTTAVFAGTLELGIANAIGNTSNVSLSTNTLNMNGFSDAIGSLTGSGSVVTGGGVLTISQGASTDTFSGIISGSGGVTVGSKAGDTGTLKLTGVNTYTGATNIALGTLAVGIANAISSSSAVSISSGATLNMNSLSDTIGQLTGAGSITNLVSGQALTVAMGANTDIFSGTIAGAGTLNVGNTSADTGILELTGSNTGFSGATTIHFGELEATNANSMGNSVVTVNSGAELILNPTANTTFANAITVNGTGVSSAGGIADISSGLTNTLSNVILGSNASIGVTNSNETLNITNGMNGSNGLTKVGAGVLVLSGANSYSGGATVTSGVLSITNSTGLGSAAATISSGAALDVSNNITVGNAITVSGSGIGGTGAINDIGTSGTTDTFSNTISLNGATTLGSTNSGDTLVFSNNIIGAQALTLVGAGTIDLAGAVGSGGGSNVLSSLNSTVNNLIIGANVTTTGTQSYGAVTLGASDTLASTNSTISFGAITGGGNALTVSSGTAQSSFGGIVSGVTNLSSTGSGGDAIGANITTVGSQSYTGTAVLGASVTLQDTASGGITLGAVTGNGHALTLNTAGGSSLGSYSDGSGASSLFQSGSGTLTLSSASGYTGGTQINSGIVSITNNTSLGTGGVTVATGAALDVNGGITIGNTINLTGTGAINDTSSSGTDILQGAVMLGSANTISAASGSTLEFASNAISGASALTLAGAGTIDLQEAVSGLTSLSATVANLTIGAGITSTGAQTYSHAVTVSGTETLATTNSAITFNSTLSGAGALTLASGTAQNVLSGIVGGGTALTSLSSTGSGGISIGANVTTNGGQSYTGTTVLASAVTLEDTSASGSVSLAAVTGNGHSLTINTLGNSSITGIYANGSGASSLTQAGSGVLTLSGANTYSGGTSVNSGILSITNSSGLGTGAATIASGSALDVSNNITVNNALTVSGTGISNTGAINDVGALGATDTISGAIALSGATTFGASNSGATLEFGSTITGAQALTLVGAGTIDLAGAVGGGGGSNVLSSLNSTVNNLIIGANVTTAGSQSYAGTTVLGSSVTLKDTSASGSVSLAAVTGNGYALTINTLGTSSITGSFAGSGSSLTQAGTGTLVLSGTNSYSGGTSITSGEVEVTNGSALGTGAAVVSSGAELAIDTTSASSFANSITVNGSGIGSNGALVDISAGAITNTLNNIVLGSSSLISVSNSGNTLNVTGTISGSGFGLEKVGAGNLELSGANTYNGTTEINQGTLTVNNANAISASTLQIDANGTLGLGMSSTLNGLTGNGSVNVGSGIILTVNNTATNIYNGALSGSGSLVITGSGTLELAAASNSFTGTVAINSGTLELNVSNALADSSGISMSSGATLNLNGTSQLINVLSGTGGTISGLSSGQTLTVATGSGTNTYAGAISGAGSLTVGNSAADTGTLILSGNNTGYTGTTTAAFGELEVSNSNALGIGSVSVTGGTLAISGVNIANTINLNGGILTGLGISGASGAVNVNSNSEVSTSGNFTMGGTVSGAGTLDLEGTGTVNVSNNITNLGGLTSNAGTTKVQSVATTGNQTYNGEVVISNNVTLASSGGNIAVNGGISGASENVIITAGPNNNSVTLAGTLAVNNISVTGTGSNNTLNLRTGNVQTFNITGANVGNVSGISEQGGTFTFTNIQNLGGSANGDTFKLLGGSISNITGGSGNNMIIAGNVANTFHISGMNSGSLTNVAGYSSIQNLVGGTSTNDFVFANNGGVSGSINGTSSAGNIIDFSAYTTPMSLALTANNSGFALNQSGAYITGSFTNIQTIAGNGISALNITNSKANTVTFTGSIAATVDDPTNVSGYDGVFNAGSGTTEVDFAPGENAVFLSPNSVSINGGPTIYFGPGITFGGNYTPYTPPPTPPSSSGSSSSTSSGSSSSNMPNVANIINSPTTNNSNSTNSPDNQPSLSATSIVIAIIQNNLTELMSEQENDDVTTQVSQPIYPNCAS